MPGMPSLEILAQEVAAEVEAQERRGDALDSKAGVLLGFSGVLTGLSAERLQGLLGVASLAATGAAALLAGLAFIPRSFPAIELRRLRDDYLTAESEFTRLRLLDTRIMMHSTTERLLKRKAWLTIGAATSLGAAIVLAVLAATV